MFVCKPYYPDTTNIVWQDEMWPRRALEDSESAFDIKKGEETKAGSRDGGKQGWKDLWRRGEKEVRQEQDSSSFSVSLQATHNRRSEREGKRLAMA